MRTSKTLSISLPPTQLKQVERLAKKENRTMSELVREALRHYEQRQTSPVNTDLIAAFRVMQENARAAGLEKLSSREIDSEIAAYRKQGTKKAKQPVR